MNSINILRSIFTDDWFVLGSELLHKHARIAIDKQLQFSYKQCHCIFLLRKCHVSKYRIVE